MNAATEIKLTPTMKRILNYVNGDIGYGVRHTATDIALATMPARWTNATLERHVDAVLDLAKASQIREHSMGWFHSNDGMCLDCDPAYN